MHIIPNSNPGKNGREGGKGAGLGSKGGLGRNMFVSRLIPAACIVGEKYMHMYMYTYM